MIGYLDDLLIVPLGLLLAHRLIPNEVLEAHREALDESVGTGISRLGLAMVVATWLLTAALVAAVMLRVL